MGADRFSVRGSLSRLSWGSPALVVARFLAACWLGGWRRRAGNGSRRWCGGPSAGFRRHGCRRKAPMDGFTASRMRAPQTASTDAAPRNGRGPGTPPTPAISPAAQAPPNRDANDLRQGAPGPAGWSFRPNRRSRNVARPIPVNQSLPLPITAAPHRLMFFIGAANVLAAMTWWTGWLGGGMANPSVPAGWMHAFTMQYQVLPAFIFGFLLTVFPRWT